MVQLRLYFASGENGPELVKTVFEHPLVQQCLSSSRGKAGGAFAHSGTFQWTPAVRALCLLLIRSKLSLLDGAIAQPVLQTLTRGSVSALDYAIGRGADWIIDMFGIDSRGNSIARRMFRRSNPERKRPGPLAIALNEQFVSPTSIQIIVDQKEASSMQELTQLMRAIIDQGDLDLSLELRSEECPVPEQMVPASLRVLQPGFLHELSLTLRATNIFSPRALRGALQEIERTPSLEGVQSDIWSELEKVDLRLAAFERLGRSLASNELETLFPSGRPLRFGVTPSQIGTLALLGFLRDFCNLPIEIDYSFAHTSDIAKGVDAGGGTSFPDCCVMTTASFAILNRARRKEYRPIMVMPAATHSIMGQTSASDCDVLSTAAEYHFLSEFPTTPAFWFQALQRSRILSSTKVCVVHSEPDETLSALKDGDASIRAILWFPYNLIVSSATNAASLLQSAAPGGFIQNILFAHQELAKNFKRRRLLNLLLRDAWLSLLEDPQKRLSIIENQLGEEEYRRGLWRYSGLYRFDAQYAA